MDQLTNDNFVQDIMSEPLIPTQPSLEDAYDDTQLVTIAVLLIKLMI